MICSSQYIYKSNVIPDKTLSKIGIKKDFLNCIKGIYKKPTAKIIIIRD